MKDYTDFYKILGKNEISLKDLLQNENLFSSVPKNWHILVTDIQGSSKAVAEGKHNDVNLTATGSIITNQEDEFMRHINSKYEGCGGQSGSNPIQGFQEGRKNENEGYLKK